jgi:pimeloyl-ACP methyl ester carboxylesterase
MKSGTAALAALLTLTMSMVAPTGGALADGMLSDFRYPYAVQRFDFASQGQELEMAYMDIRPSVPSNGKTIVLLHGKNFCGATWEGVIPPLGAAGYRVIVPDQIGFCKSTKPQAYQMSLHQLAANTHALLRRAGVERPILVGHSMGGMLGARYVLSYPDDVAALVLINPIGLEDWSAKGVPPRTIDELLAGERKTTAAKIKAYQQKTYYDGRWRPEFDRWVDMLASTYTGKGSDLAALSQARASEMIFTEPVVHEFPRIAVPTVLLIGERDTTAIGKDRAPPDLAAELGNYPVLAREAQSRIPNSRLVTFPELGHAPHIEEPSRVNAALLDALRHL